MKQAHEFRAQSVFDTHKARENPQQLPLPLPPGMSVFDMQEWYQLALGRYLAPAKIGSSGGVEYLLRGEDRPGKHLKHTLRQEVKALEADFKQLGQWLAGQAESKGDAVQRLWVLVSILELRLPDPQADPESFRICQGALQITQWGIERGQERKLADLVGDGSALREYCKSVHRALKERYLEPSDEESEATSPVLAPTRASIFRGDDLIDDGTQAAQLQRPWRPLLHGFVGAILSAALLLAIYEGRRLRTLWTRGSAAEKPAEPDGSATPAPGDSKKAAVQAADARNELTPSDPAASSKPAPSDSSLGASPTDSDAHSQQNSGASPTPARAPESTHAPVDAGIAAPTPAPDAPPPPPDRVPPPGSGDKHGAPSKQPDKQQETAPQSPEGTVPQPAPSPRNGGAAKGI